MNNPFLNRLANILDGLPPYQLSHEASYYNAFNRHDHTDVEPVLDHLDHFFMTGDVRDNDFEPSWIPWEGDTCGNLEAWAALTAAREQDIPLPLSQEAVARIAAEALGLPEPPAGTVLLTSLSPILNPACLLGRFDAITPQHTASVLRACADGQSPVEAWNHVSLNIRNQRLLELADMVKDLPSTSHNHFQAVDELWTPRDLRSHLSTLILDPSQSLPFVMNDGSWGGNLALWTLSRFGDHVTNHLSNTDPDQARHIAGMVLGLTYKEATALFCGLLAPDMVHPVTNEIYLTVVTRDTPSTSRNLKLLAVGAMPPAEWNHVKDILAICSLPTWTTP